MGFFDRMVTTLKNPKKGPGDNNSDPTPPNNSTYPAQQQQQVPMNAQLNTYEFPTSKRLSQQGLAESQGPMRSIGDRSLEEQHRFSALMGRGAGNSESLFPILPPRMYGSMAPRPSFSYESTSMPRPTSLAIPSGSFTAPSPMPSGLLPKALQYPFGRQQGPSQVPNQLPIQRPTNASFNARPSAFGPALSQYAPGYNLGMPPRQGDYGAPRSSFAATTDGQQQFSDNLRQSVISTAGTNDSPHRLSATIPLSHAKLGPGSSAMESPMRRSSRIVSPVFRKSQEQDMQTSIPRMRRSTRRSRASSGLSTPMMVTSATPSSQSGQEHRRRRVRSRSISQRRLTASMGTLPKEAGSLSETPSPVHERKGGPAKEVHHARADTVERHEKSGSPRTQGSFELPESTQPGVSVERVASEDEDDNVTDTAKPKPTSLSSSTSTLENIDKESSAVFCEVKSSLENTKGTVEDEDSPKQGQLTDRPSSVVTSDSSLKAIKLPQEKHSELEYVSTPLKAPQSAEKSATEKQSLNDTKLSISTNQVSAPQVVNSESKIDESFFSQRGGNESEQLRRTIAERFLTVLASRQYCGKVLKVSGISIVSPDAETLLREKNVVVARAEGSSRVFYDELQLVREDAPVDASGPVTTPLILFCVEKMVRSYVAKEQDSVTAFSDDVNAVFVTELQGMLIKEESLTAVATLNLVWQPSWTVSEEVLCPLHKRPLEVFDPRGKGLGCALCCSARGEKAMVLADMMTPQMTEDFIKRLLVTEEAIAASQKANTANYTLAQRGFERSISTIKQQFETIAKVLETRLQELTDAVKVRRNERLSAIERDIRRMNSTTALLSAARGTLESAQDGLKPQQLPVVAAALKAKVDSPGAKDSLRGAGLNGELDSAEGSSGGTVIVNVGAAISQIEAIALRLPPHRRRQDGTVGAGGEKPKRTLKRQSIPKVKKAPVRRPSLTQSTDDETEDGPQDNPKESEAWTNTEEQNNCVSSQTKTDRREVNERSLEAVSAAVQADLGLREIVNEGAEGKKSFKPLLADRPGTSIFNYPLQEMLKRHRVVKWGMKVESIGEWLGVGVAVGKTPEAWRKESVFDMHHLWMVPSAFIGKDIFFEVAHIGSGNVKLTVLSETGGRINNERIPHWNARRDAYPQVTFGKSAGRLIMFMPPSPVA